MQQAHRAHRAQQGSEEPLTLTEIQGMIEEEEVLAENVLHLTANETLLSPQVQGTLSSSLNTRYLLEHLDMRKDSPSRLGNLLFRGLDHINAIERSATEVCKTMFGADYAEFRCISGLHAMQTSFTALTQPGDRIMRVATKDGGHFLTELICRSLGRSSSTYVYKGIGEMDLDGTREVFERDQPSLLYIDAMNYLFPFPLRELREIVGDTPIIFDASHTFGLIAGGQFQDPLREGADILQANTHKTFFGPQKGIILGTNRAAMERIGYVLSNGLVSSQHTAATIALFVALHEAYYWGREYAAQVIDNARYLAASLHRRGVPVLAVDRGFTWNHALFVDTRPLGSGPLMLQRLLEANISANRIVAFEHVDALRLGVQEITRRGYSKADVEKIAEWFARLLLEDEDPSKVGEEVVELVRARRSIRYCGEDGNVTTPVPKKRLVTPEPVASHRSRWVDIRLTHEDVSLDPGMFREVRALGELASTFEHQTDTAGNISFLSGDQAFVTVSGAYIKDLATDDFAEMSSYENGLLHCRGTGTPSSEAYMHYLVRQQVDAACIVHNHYIPGDELEELDLVITPPKEYGSVELAEAVSEACKRNSAIYVRRHGLVFWGRSIDECRSQIERFAAKVARNDDSSAQLRSQVSHMGHL